MICAFTAGVNGVASPVATTTTTRDIGFFLRVRELFSGILPRPKALAYGKTPMQVCRHVHDPRPVVLPGDMLQLHWTLAAPDRIVIGTGNTTVVRYEDERIALAAHRAPRIGWKQCCAAGGLVIEPFLDRGSAIPRTRGRSHAVVPGASLRRL
jgi:hypothetical protein